MQVGPAQPAISVVVEFGRIASGSGVIVVVIPWPSYRSC
ncbi:hypothetical protein I552_9538 [Mycobacterium xenopi 3993]|nr:hypothetical protein I552_9538 [Mycobacterium xenopi 3993]